MAIVFTFVVMIFCALPQGVQAEEPISHVVAYKSEGRLELHAGGRVVREYPAMFGLMPGSKKREGDFKTPTGTYTLSPGRRSEFHWFMPISYPNEEDKAAGRTGSAIGLHGTGQIWFRRFGQWLRLVNWTSGCIAVSDEQIDEIHGLIGDRAVPIHIRP